MFYLLLLLVILILFMLIQNIKGNHNYPVILILPYFAALFSMILYISKDTYYYHLIKDYFYLPDFIWRWFFFIRIGKSNLIRLMNLSSISIVIISTYFAFYFFTSCSSKIRRISLILVWAYSALQAVMFDPCFNRKLYYFLYPDYMTSAGYLSLEHKIYSLTHIINIAVVLLCLICLLIAFYHAPKLRLFQFHYLFLAISYGTLAFVYVYFISSCPNFYLKISKISGTYSYRSIPLASSALIYRSFPYILIPAAAVITLCAYRLTRLSGQTYLQELKISKEISSSETTSKIFCHYIKNEILALQSEVETLYEGNEKGKIDGIHKHLDTLYARIDELHRSTKTGELNLQMRSLQDLITGTLQLFEHELKEMDVKLNFPPVPVLAMIDPVYMEQAVHNIIRNSIDAMEQTPAQKRCLTVSLAVVNQWIKIDLQDTGKGISGENLEHIFLPFYSSHPYSRHWGVGLTLTYKVIHAHEGKIVVTSTPGHGTTVEILLPSLNPSSHLSERKRYHE